MKKQIIVGILAMSTIFVSTNTKVLANENLMDTSSLEIYSNTYGIKEISKNEDGSIKIKLNSDPGNGVFMINSGDTDTNIANTNTNELTIRASYVEQLNSNNQYYIQHVSWDTSLKEIVLNITEPLMNTVLEDNVDLPLIENTTPLYFNEISKSDRLVKGFAAPNTSVQMFVNGNFSGVTTTDEYGKFNLSILPNINLDKLDKFTLTVTNNDSSTESLIVDL